MNNLKEFWKNWNKKYGGNLRCVRDYEITTLNKQCTSTFTKRNGEEIHHCELFDGHAGNHRCVYEWLEEESNA